MNDFILPLKRYAEFTGRSRRQEYWMWTLFNIVVSLVLQGIVMATAATADSGGGVLVLIASGLSLIFSFGTFIPSLAVSVRRLHDIGKSGWTILLALIPIVGGIILLVYMVQEGTAGSNQYGADPKAENGGFTQEGVLDSSVE